MRTSIDALMHGADAGDGHAVQQLFSVLYAELHQLAESHLRRQPADFTLGTTTLLHDAYLQMAARDGITFPDRARFFAYASRVMRGMVIDRIRRRQAQKRGAGFEFTTFEDDVSPDSGARTAPRLDALEAAMDDLTRIDGALAELVDLHFFSGFSFAEIAALRQVSERTVQRDWRKARLLLAAQLDALEQPKVV